MRKPKTALVWRAVSSDDQVAKNGDVKVSLDNQLMMAKDAADKHGLNVAAVLTVPGESRYITLLEDARDQVDGYITIDGIDQPCKPYQELFNWIRSKPKAFDVLICLNTSRLGRKASLSMTIIQLCKDAGIICYETQSPQPTLDLDKAHTYNDMLLYAINSVRDQQEVIKLIDANQTGMIRRIENGHFPGDPPYGWRKLYDEHGKVKVEIDEKASEAVELIFTRYVDYGEGLEKISDRLNELGYPAPRADRWAYTAVQNIVERAWRYAGYNDINLHSKRGRKHTRARSRWPAIISEEMAVDALNEQKRRATSRRSVNTTHAFSGCVWCAKCTRLYAIENGLPPEMSLDDMFMVLYEDVKIRTLIRMSMCTSTRVRKGQRRRFFRFRCDGKHSGAIISVSKLEHAVRSAIKQIETLGPEPMESETDSADNAENINAAIAAQEDKIARLKASIATADDDYYIYARMDAERHRRIVDKLNEQIAACDAEILSLTKLLTTIAHDDKRSERAADFLARGLDMLTHEQANVFFRQHIRIWVEDSKVVRIKLI
jgi:DNA invertase Pin-like site-specific DNA recombinase